MSNSTYKQPIKQKIRSEALEYAVTLLTTDRQKAAIAPENYVRAVRAKCATLDYDPRYLDASENSRDEDVKSWEDFRTSVVGRLKPEDLTIAYLAGPEPTNDIQKLLELGVRAENIWAFESGNGEFESAIKDVKNSEIRGVKLIKMRMEDYFSATPRRFDIIYFDACATFPSYKQKTIHIISTIFRSSSLSSLGVLITNFSAPDLSSETDLENYSQLISSYLYSKGTLDCSIDGAFYTGDSAEALGYLLSPETMSSFLEEEEEEEEEDFRYFNKEVKDKFNFYYGSFITRHIMDISSITAPTARLMSSKLWDNMFAKSDDIIGNARAWITQHSIDDNLEDPSFLHGNIHEDNNYSLVRVISYMDMGGDSTTYSDSTRKFFKRWQAQLVDSDGTDKGIENILAFYACKENSEYWKAGMLDVKEFNYRLKMPQLCDVPTEELGFYPIFAQFAYPAHCNVKKARRYTYVADGKTNRMFLDILPFDECRYIYDWLSSGHLVASDLEKMSTQLTFRFALDALVKNIHNYQHDYLFGAHAVPLSEEFDSAEFKERIDLSADS